MQIDEPFLSPNLQVWSTPLNSKLLITGSLGVDPKLVELKSNYLRFKFIVKNEEDEEKILERLRRKVCEMEEILGEKFEEDPDKLLVSRQADVTKVEQTLSSDVENCPTEIEKGKIMCASIKDDSIKKETEKKLCGDNPQAAFESVRAGEGNPSDGKLRECDDCWSAAQNCSPPRM